jgi:hypothetical protein
VKILYKDASFLSSTTGGVGTGCIKEATIDASDFSRARLQHVKYSNVAILKHPW